MAALLIDLLEYQVFVLLDRVGLHFLVLVVLNIVVEGLQSLVATESEFFIIEQRLIHDTRELKWLPFLIRFAQIVDKVLHFSLGNVLLKWFLDVLLILFLVLYEILQL